jgi:hypothetical protein
MHHSASFSDRYHDSFYVHPTNRRQSLFGDTLYVDTTTGSTTTSTTGAPQPSPRTPKMAGLSRVGSSAFAYSSSFKPKRALYQLAKKASIVGLIMANVLHLLNNLAYSFISTFYPLEAVELAVDGVEGFLRFVVLVC